MRRRIAATVLVTALAAAGCGGGGGGDDPTTPATSSSGGPVPSVSAPTGNPAAAAQFRACHKSRDGVLVLILLFEVRDRSLIGGFEGAIDFHVTAVDPATWTTGDPVTVDPGTNDHVRQITVPADEPAPSEVTLEVVTTAAVDATNVLATNQVTVPVPASSCSRA